MSNSIYARFIPLLLYDYYPPLYPIIQAFLFVLCTRYFSNPYNKIITCFLEYIMHIAVLQCRESDASCVTVPWRSMSLLKYYYYNIARLYNTFFSLCVLVHVTDITNAMYYSQLASVQALHVTTHNKWDIILYEETEKNLPILHNMCIAFHALFVVIGCFDGKICDRADVCPCILLSFEVVASLQFKASLGDKHRTSAEIMLANRSF